ncbi:MAG: hypothetical protein EAZ07_05195 [Cytophagales bacterium]|nr:MAG: hypothetical protein EAZ07_05195 [Cytophagales bacterium]
MNFNGHTLLTFFNSKFNFSLQAFDNNKTDYSLRASGDPNPTDMIFVSNTFQEFYNSLGINDYTRCYRNIYNLLSMIHLNKTLIKKEKFHYFAIVKGSIKSEMLKQLFYYCTIPRNVNSDKPESFKALIQYYNFFEFMEHECLIMREHISFYPYITFRFLGEDEKNEVTKKRNETLDDLLKYI